MTAYRIQNIKRAKLNLMTKMVYFTEPTNVAFNTKDIVSDKSTHGSISSLSIESVKYTPLPLR
jgi:hypothetical protein